MRSDCLSGLQQHDSLRHALSTLERSVAKIALVVDGSGKLLRTVTDGDIRRGLLAGLDLAAPIAALDGRAPLTVRHDEPHERVLGLLDEHGVSAVVRVDPAGRPLEIVDRSRAAGTTWMSPPHIGAREIELVQAAFEDNWVAPAGPNLLEFERRLSMISGLDHALAVSSGTAALHLALRVLDVRTGDRVYVSDLTFVATLQPILYEKAVPVLVDSEANSWNMSPAALQRLLVADQQQDQLPAAIIVAHIYGQSAEIAEICALAARFGVPVVEDAAESLGASFAGRPSGFHGAIAAYSFNGNKIITTSGGGALVSRNGELIERARYLATQGRDPYEHYQHSAIAYNYRLSNVLAGIGVGQLEILNDRVAARREIFRRYFEGLSDLPAISFQGEPAGSAGNRWLTVLRIDPDRCHLHPFQIMRRMREHGIETRPGWKPMHLQPLCAGLWFEPDSGRNPMSGALYHQTLCLPSGSALGVAEQDRIMAVLRDILKDQ